MKVRSRYLWETTEPGYCTFQNRTQMTIEAVKQIVSEKEPPTPVAATEGGCSCTSC
jgi:hypothetical protein